MKMNREEKELARKRVGNSLKINRAFQIFIAGGTIVCVNLSLFGGIGVIYNSKGDIYLILLGLLGIVNAILLVFGLIGKFQELGDKQKLLEGENQRLSSYTVADYKNDHPNMFKK